MLSCNLMIKLPFFILGVLSVLCGMTGISIHFLYPDYSPPPGLPTPLRGGLITTAIVSLVLAAIYTQSMQVPKIIKWEIAWSGFAIGSTAYFTAWFVLGALGAGWTATGVTAVILLPVGRLGVQLFHEFALRENIAKYLVKETSKSRRKLPRIDTLAEQTPLPDVLNYATTASAAMTKFLSDAGWTTHEICATAFMIALVPGFFLYHAHPAQRAMRRFLKDPR